MMVKEAVGKGAAELLVEKDEQQRYFGPFLCEPIYGRGLAESRDPGGESDSDVK